MTPPAEAADVLSETQHPLVEVGGLLDVAHSQRKVVQPPHRMLLSISYPILHGHRLDTVTLYW
jgi:hypothetical protein